MGPPPPPLFSILPGPLVFSEHLGWRLRVVRRAFSPLPWSSASMNASSNNFPSQQAIRPRDRLILTAHLLGSEICPVQESQVAYCRLFFPVSCGLVCFFFFCGCGFRSGPLILVAVPLNRNEFPPSPRCSSRPFRAVLASLFEVSPRFVGVPPPPFWFGLGSLLIAAQVCFVPLLGSHLASREGHACSFSYVCPVPHFFSYHHFQLAPFFISYPALSPCLTPLLHSSDSHLFFAHRSSVPPHPS